MHWFEDADNKPLSSRHSSLQWASSLELYNENSTHVLFLSNKLHGPDDSSKPLSPEPCLPKQMTSTHERGKYYQNIFFHRVWRQTKFFSSSSPPYKRNHRCSSVRPCVLSASWSLRWFARQSCTYPIGADSTVDDRSEPFSRVSRCSKCEACVESTGRRPTSVNRTEGSNGILCPRRWTNAIRDWSTNEDRDACCHPRSWRSPRPETCGSISGQRCIRNRRTSSAVGALWSADRMSGCGTRRSTGPCLAWPDRAMNLSTRLDSIEKATK